MVLRPIYARTQQILEFYLFERYQIRAPEGTWTAPKVLLAGPSTDVKGDLIYPRLVRTFTIHFHPAGLHALFRIPIHQLADKALPGESVLGRESLICSTGCRTPSRSRSLRTQQMNFCYDNCVGRSQFHRLSWRPDGCAEGMER